MDRVQFAHSMNSSIPTEEMIIKHFDEMMALYDLVFSYSITSINGTSCNNRAEFIISFNNNTDIQQIISLVSNRIIYKYSRQFICTVQQLDSSSIKIVLN